MSRDVNPFTLEFIFSRTVAESPPEYCARLGDCMIWQGGCDGDGYGRARFSITRWRLHVAVYTLVYGPVPDGLIVCHYCDRPSCVAPLHLTAQTDEWNSWDKAMKDRSMRGSRNYMTKLTEDQVRAIRIDTRSHRRIATDYGIAKVSVGRIKRYQQWGWLE